MGCLSGTTDSIAIIVSKIATSRLFVSEQKTKSQYNKETRMSSGEEETGHGNAGLRTHEACQALS